MVDRFWRSSCNPLKNNLVSGANERRLIKKGGDDGKVSSSVKRNNNELVWWCTSVIPALRRLRQEDLKFKASITNDPYKVLRRAPRKCLINVTDDA
jgi:hypothetical protein